MRWKTATLLASRLVARDIISLRFVVQGWEKHTPGQHYDVRCIGTESERKYSIASAPEEKGIVEFGVELLKGGRVSPLLFKLKVGDTVEINGPIGEYFTWNINTSNPLVLIGSGSGIVPFMSMLRHYADQTGKNKKPRRDLVLLASAKTREFFPYFEEITNCASVRKEMRFVPTITKKAPPAWKDLVGRIDEEMIKKTTKDIVKKNAQIYVSGGMGFVEKIIQELLKAGFQRSQIKAENFG